MPWEAGLCRVCVPSHFQTGRPLEVTAKLGGRRGWRIYGGPLWQKVPGQLFCPQGSLPRLQLLPSPSCSLSFSRPGGRNSVGTFPLLLVSGCFPALWWSRDPLRTSANRPFTACLRAPSEHASSTSNRTLLMSRAGIWTWIGLIEKPGLLIMMLHCAVGDLSRKGQVYNHSWKNKTTQNKKWAQMFQLCFHQCPWQLSPECPTGISCHAIFLWRDKLLVERSELNKSLGGFNWFQSVMVSRWLCQDLAFWQVLWNWGLGQPVL